MDGRNEKPTTPVSDFRVGSSEQSQAGVNLEDSSDYRTSNSAESKKGNLSGKSISDLGISNNDNKNVRFTADTDALENDLSSRSTETSDNSKGTDGQDEEDRPARHKRKPKVSFTHLRNNGKDGDDETFIKKIINNLTGNQGGLVPGLAPIPSENENGKDDIEKNNRNEEIPLSDLADASKIVDVHEGDNKEKLEALKLESDVNCTSDGETLGSSSKNSFLAPAVDHFDDYAENNSSDDNEGFIETSTYVPPPSQVKSGVLGSLLKLYQNEDQNSSSIFSDSQAVTTDDEGISSTAGNKDVPVAKRSRLQNLKGKAKKGRMPRLKKRLKTEAKITVHIADILQRHRFILRMCRALMMYGAPTHRLEEYMVMTSRVLEIDGQFLYLPGCMIVSFGDATTRTSEVQLVRCTQGLNLWKLHQVHAVYKRVVHDTLGADEGNALLDQILADTNLYPPWMCVLLYAFCSAMVTPYAFGGDWVNLAISFFMGLCVGSLQFILSQKSYMYSNVFEISASIVVSFCGRAFGSIPRSHICFGAVTQGSLALILPGYIILCGALELQSRSLVAGAVRMFYAIIYSLFLGFGITLGSALFGWMYHNATNEISCPQLISPWFRFLFVPAFTISISLLNQAHISQLPVMVFISCTGYVVTYWAGKHFANSTEFTAALAAFVIGVLGNLYSRIWKGLAVSAMLPAIFVQVPSGIASQNSLLSGLQSANTIVNANETVTTSTSDPSSSMSFGMTMIQVCVGISVGLFASSLFVYPFGKKKTGLFSL
ncbi:CQI_4a_G0028580.mRNA.1.CDS.1 [Saccharomyces cerevisiae]|nr:CQI_4a_G0028580.mRNA.1.CDS.1 [Saccharomyces cerevisiae]CAI7351923.1 CQI_4a_G0028580.mRNA.1.CDS.1 [Saccharomyces cerevisiae]